MNTKRVLKIIPLIEISISIIFLVVSFLIKDIPDNKPYFYKNGKIIASSWYDILSDFTAYLLVILFIIALFIGIFRGIKFKDKDTKIGITLVCTIFCSFVIAFSNILVTVLWSDEDYSKSYYKFTDGHHTIVIEEESFLLYGGGTIYQIQDDNKAIVLNTFITDDGGRNNGNYEIDWHDDYAEITYNNFDLQNSKATIKVEFSK